MFGSLDVVVKPMDKVDKDDYSDSILVGTIKGKKVEIHCELISGSGFTGDGKWEFKGTYDGKKLDSEEAKKMYLEYQKIGEVRSRMVEAIKSETKTNKKTEETNKKIAEVRDRIVSWLSQITSKN